MHSACFRSRSAIILAFREQRPGATHWGSHPSTQVLGIDVKKLYLYIGKIEKRCNGGVHGAWISMTAITITLAISIGHSFLLESHYMN